MQALLAIVTHSLDCHGKSFCVDSREVALGFVIETPGET